MNFMVPAVVHIAHGSVNTRHRLQRAWIAHRQKKVPKPRTLIVLPGFEFLFFVFLAEALKEKPICPVVKKKKGPAKYSKVSVSI